MKSVGDILKDLGFNKDAPQNAQIAFFRHLISATCQSPVIDFNSERPQHVGPKKDKKLMSDKKQGEQLEFDFLKTGAAEASNS